MVGGEFRKRNVWQQRVVWRAHFLSLPTTVGEYSASLLQTNAALPRLHFHFLYSMLACPVAWSIVLLSIFRFLFD